MLKFLFDSPVFQFLLGRTIGGYMLFVGITTRWRKVNQAAVEPFWRGEKRMIGCVWHGRFALVHKLWRFRKGMPRAVMLVSPSREGNITQHITRTVGAHVVRGTSAKAGKRKGTLEALRTMIRIIEEGDVICITPDGPKGPRMRIKTGTVQLAKLSGAHLMSVAWSSNARHVFKSWDKFMWPLPFGRGALVWGNPIAPPTENADEAEIERVRAAFEAEMIRISQEADRLAGVEVIEPEPSPAKALAAEAASAP